MGSVIKCFVIPPTQVVVVVVVCKNIYIYIYIYIYFLDAVHGPFMHELKVQVVVSLGS